MLRQNCCILMVFSLHTLYIVLQSVLLAGIQTQYKRERRSTTTGLNSCHNPHIKSSHEQCSTSESTRQDTFNRLLRSAHPLSTGSKYTHTHTHTHTHNSPTVTISTRYGPTAHFVPNPFTPKAAVSLCLHLYKNSQIHELNPFGT